MSEKNRKPPKFEGHEIAQVKVDLLGRSDAIDSWHKEDEDAVFVIRGHRLKVVHESQQHGMVRIEKFQLYQVLEVEDPALAKEWIERLEAAQEEKDEEEKRQRDREAGQGRIDEDIDPKPVGDNVTSLPLAGEGNGEDDAEFDGEGDPPQAE